RGADRPGDAALSRARLYRARPRDGGADPSRPAALELNEIRVIRYWPGEIGTEWFQGPGICVGKSRVRRLSSPRWLVLARTVRLASWLFNRRRLWLGNGSRWGLP